MLTAVSALQWEIRRSLRVRLLGVFFLLLLLPGLTLLPNLQRQMRDIEIPYEELAISPNIHLVITIINLIICLFGIGQAVGMSVRQYTLPIPTQALATIRIIPGAVCCAGLYLALSSLFNVLFSASWPCLSPALTYGVAYMVMYATIYRFRGNETRMGVAGLVMGTVLLFWVGGHYGTWWWVRPEHAWPELSLPELLTLMLAAYLSWRSLVDALERDRRGAGWGRVIARTDPASVDAFARRRPARRFMSAFSALFWQDWRQDGWLIPIVTVSLLSISATVHVGSLALFERVRLESGPAHGVDLGVSLMGFLPLCAILPWFLGLSGQYGKRAARNQVWPTGQSTLPLSDAAMGWICLTRVIASSLVAGVGIVTVGLVWYGAVEIIAQTYDLPNNHIFRHEGISITECYRYAGSLALTLWLTAGFSTAATLTGRRWIASLPLMIIPVWIAGVFVASVMPTPWAAQTVLVFLTFTVLGLALFWTVTAYIVGIAFDLITYRSILAGFLLFALTEIVGIALIGPLRSAFHNGLDTTSFNFWIMLFALAGAPPALIPLATYYNRHR